MEVEEKVVEDVKRKPMITFEEGEEEIESWEDIDCSPEEEPVEVKPLKITNLKTETIEVESPEVESPEIETSEVESPVDKCPWGKQPKEVFKMSFEKTVEEFVDKLVEEPEDDFDWIPVCKQVEVAKPVCKPVEVAKPVCKSVKETNNKYTMLCRHFIRGKCNRGDNCNFAHGFDQWNPNVCSFRHKCNKGDKCRWFHPDRESKEEFAKRTNMV